MLMQSRWGRKVDETIRRLKIRSPSAGVSVQELTDNCPKFINNNSLRMPLNVKAVCNQNENTDTRHNHTHTAKVSGSSMELEDRTGNPSL